MKSIIYSDKAPNPIGPYSQAISAEGKTIYISMQIPLDAAGVLAGNTIQEQTAQVIENIRSILESAGAGIENIVKVTVYMKDLGEFAAMNEVYSRYFSDSKPARAAVEVCRIPKDVLIAMDAVAVI
jgi:2-iminobutanoate/2-iminopropanoate deaminase